MSMKPLQHLPEFDETRMLHRNREVNSQNDSLNGHRRKRTLAAGVRGGIGISESRGSGRRSPPGEPAYSKLVAAPLLAASQVS